MDKLPEDFMKPEEYGRRAALAQVENFRLLNYTKLKNLLLN